MSTETKWTKGEWSVEEIKSEGDYGDGGPDCRTGFTTYAVVDSTSRPLFDALNRDGRVSCVHEEGYDDEDGGRVFAWDEMARADMTLAASAPGLYSELAQLVRLIEPLERDGTLNVPGLATLNGARRALAEARGES